MSYACIAKSLGKITLMTVYWEGRKDEGREMEGRRGRVMGERGSEKGLWDGKKLVERWNENK